MIEKPSSTPDNKPTIAGDIVVAFRNIRKTFPGIVALDEINLDVKRGQIHALLGENGAGKSTLVNILYGLYRQDSGEIYLDGQPYKDNSPRHAIEHGIGMIHQYFMLIPDFTVLENVMIGQKSPHPPMLDKNYFRKEIERVSHKYGITVDLDLSVKEISMGMQQKVEILKALYKGARLLILDEPTSVLTPQESQELFQMLVDLNNKGTSIIYISHKLNEVMQISDHISVLRDGRMVATMAKKDTNPNELSRLMVGRDVNILYDTKDHQVGEEVLRVEELTLKEHHKRDRFLVKNVSFSVLQGEIVGIAGVDENGQKELAEIISGLRRATSGKIFLNGRDVSAATTRQLIEAGLSFIPADRRNQGLVLDFSVAENTILDTHYKKPFSRGFRLQTAAINQFAQELVKQYDVRTPGIEVPVKNLSGGNQQKLIIGREFSKEARFLLVMQPTWGLDVGAIEYVHRRLLRARDDGMAVLLISSDLEEVRKLSNRILLMYEGEIVGQADAQTSVEEIGMMMAGSVRHKA